MRKWARSTAQGALLTATLVAVGSGVALADNTTSGRQSVLGGNQVKVPVNLPVNVCGTAVALFGGGASDCAGQATVVTGGSGSPGSTTSGRQSIGGGNQVNVPVNAPVNVCGTSAGVLGEAFADCTGGSSVRTHGSSTAASSMHTSARGASTSSRDRAGRAAVDDGGDGGGHTSGRNSILGGNQVDVPVNVPVNVCGLAVGVLGDASSQCSGGSSVRTRGSRSAGARTSGRSSILGGNQVNVPVNVPVNLCGTSVAVLGDSVATCTGSGEVTEECPVTCPTPEPAPQECPQSCPTPMPTSTPQGCPESCPTPMPTSTPQGCPESCPTPMPTSTPQACPESCPEPTVPPTCACPPTSSMAAADLSHRVVPLAGLPLGASAMHLAGPAPTGKQDLELEGVTGAVQQQTLPEVSGDLNGVGFVPRRGAPVSLGLPLES